MRQFLSGLSTAAGLQAAGCGRLYMRDRPIDNSALFTLNWGLVIHDQHGDAMWRKVADHAVYGHVVYFMASFFYRDGSTKLRKVAICGGGHPLQNKKVSLFSEEYNTHNN